MISATGCSKLHSLKFANDTKAVEIPRKRITSQLTMFSSFTNISKLMVLENGDMLEVKSDGLKDLSLFDLPNVTSKDHSSLHPQKVVPNDLINDEDFPKEININLAYGYDKSVMEYFVKEYSFGWYNQTMSWIKDIHTHTQSYYLLSSLKTKMNLQVLILSKYFYW